MVTVAQPPTMIGGVRLPPGAPTDLIRSALPSAQGLILVPVAVAAEGRRTADAPTLDATLLSAWASLRSEGFGVVAVLDHAGPRASAWSLERAVAATETPDVLTGRRPQALDDEGWHHLTARYQRAATLCQAEGVPCILGIDDDGLLHGALASAPHRVRAVHEACGPIDVSLVVEELCPGGLDATDGIAMARALCQQGASTIYASGGSLQLPVLRSRSAARTDGGRAQALASAAWLVGRVPARIVGMAPTAGLHECSALAHSWGLAGVIHERLA